MPGKLQAEIRQTRPFDQMEEEAVLNIVRTAEVLQRTIADFLKQFDLSPVQYNVLRILRGAGLAGATCSQVRERLLTRDPDITRLLDRMEARGLIARERAAGLAYGCDTHIGIGSGAGDGALINQFGR